MSKIQRLIEYNGKWMQDAVDLIFDCPMEEVLQHNPYSIERLEDYVKSAKSNIRKEILHLIKNQNQYSWVETGEPFIFEDSVVEGVFEYKGNVAQFVKHLKVASASDLERYKRIISESDFIKLNQE